MRPNVIDHERHVSFLLFFVSQLNIDEYLLEEEELNYGFPPCGVFALVFDQNPDVSIVYAFLLLFLAFPLHC